MKVTETNLEGCFVIEPRVFDDGRGSFFESFNHPSYIVYPLAILKILGVIMILWRKSDWLTEWAYAGFFFDVVLAFFAHYFANDDVNFTLIGLILILLSYFFGKVVRAKS